MSGTHAAALTTVPGEIEAVLIEHPRISQCAVIDRSDQSGDKRLVSYIVPTQPDSGLNTVSLREFLQRKLPDYMVPTSFVFLDRLPLTLHGKLDRNALPAPDHLQSDGVFTAPRTDAEKLLAQIWSDVLGVERVGVHDNFFDLGGDSILSIQIVAKAQEQGLNLSIQLLFQNPTISDLAPFTVAHVNKRCESSWFLIWSRITRWVRVSLRW